AVGSGDQLCDDGAAAGIAGLVRLFGEQVFVASTVSGVEIGLEISVGRTGMGRDIHLVQFRDLGGVDFASQDCVHVVIEGALLGNSREANRGFGGGHNVVGIFIGFLSEIKLPRLEIQIAENRVFSSGKALVMLHCLGRG